MHLSHFHLKSQQAPPKIRNPFVTFGSINHIQYITHSTMRKIVL